MHEYFLGLEYHTLLLFHFPKHAVRQCVCSYFVALCIITSKKVISANYIIEVLVNGDSEDDLIPESDSSESCDSGRPKSPEIALISDTADETTPET
jgi:hypothetical protein